MKLIYFSLIFIIGCTNTPLVEDSSANQNTLIPLDENRDDFDTTSITLNYSQVFQKAFIAGSTHKDAYMTCSFYIYEAGNLNVESGKIIACDPIQMFNATPFKAEFPKGIFPVQLSMAKMENDERVAFSRVLFSDSIVTNWAYALMPDQQPLSLLDSTVYCYGVDGGMGLFIDSVANDIARDFDQPTWNHVFINKAIQNGYKGYSHEFDNHSLVTFSSGYGDGCYATYIGYDANGKICQLLTDFGLVGWWEVED